MEREQQCGGGKKEAQEVRSAWVRTTGGREWESERRGDRKKGRKWSPEMVTEPDTETETEPRPRISSPGKRAATCHTERARLLGRRRTWSRGPRFAEGKGAKKKGRQKNKIACGG